MVGTMVGTLTAAVVIWGTSELRRVGFLELLSMSFGGFVYFRGVWGFVMRYVLRRLYEGYIETWPSQEGWAV